LVETVAVGFENSRDDGSFAQRVPVDCGAAELRRGFVPADQISPECNAQPQAFLQRAGRQWRFNSRLWRWTARSAARSMRRGFIGVVIKHNLDRLIAASFLDTKAACSTIGRRLEGGAAQPPLQYRSEVSRDAAAVIDSISVGGVAMTVRRLRDAGQPVWLVVLSLFR